jgi:hypothetical protein
MFKRTLIVAAAVLATQSGVALADNNYVFDEPYWKNPVRTGAATSVQSTDANAVNAQFAKYKQVDGYNN